MKTKITLLAMAFLISLSTFAQQGINYKALIKDNLGNVVANQNITVQFTILKGVAQTNVYQETHSPTTDANGIVILNIGEGTTSDDFSTIGWSNADHFLNMQVDTGSGLTDMGTTQFMSVPYALSAANVTGLETIDEGIGVGHRLKNADPAFYANIGNNAVDLSKSIVPSETYGASGEYATATGFSTTASGVSSTAIGGNTTASGIVSTAMGFHTEASAYASTAIGSYNIGGGYGETWIGSDPLFEVGNGLSEANRSNAITILKNGKVGIGNNQPVGFLEVKATNSSGQPNLNLIHQGVNGARINFSNTDTTNGNVWTFYGDTNDVDANSSFNLYHSNTGNIVNVKGDGKVTITGDLAVTNTTKIGSAGVAISEIVKLTGVTDGSGTTNISYPAGYNWENTHVVSVKVKSTVGGLGVNWYTSLGNYNSGDGQSVYVNLRNQVNPANTSTIQLQVSDSQYVGGEYSLVLMKID